MVSRGSLMCPALPQDENTNPTWNEAHQIIHTDDFAQKHLARITKSFDVTRSNLEKGIAMLEQQLAAPIESKAAQSISAEIRAYAKNLPNEKRHAFIQQAIDEGDCEGLGQEDPCAPSCGQGCAAGSNGPALNLDPGDG